MADPLLPALSRQISEFKARSLYRPSSKKAGVLNKQKSKQPNNKNNKNKDKTNKNFFRVWVDSGSGAISPVLVLQGSCRKPDPWQVSVSLVMEAGRIPGAHWLVLSRFRGRPCFNRRMPEEHINTDLWLAHTQMPTHARLHSERTRWVSDTLWVSEIKKAEFSGGCYCCYPITVSLPRSHSSLACGFPAIGLLCCISLTNHFTVSSSNHSGEQTS